MFQFDDATETRWDIFSPYIWKNAVRSEYETIPLKAEEASFLPDKEHQSFKILIPLAQLKCIKSMTDHRK